MARTLLLTSILVVVCVAWAAADVVTGTVTVSRNLPTAGTTVLLPMLDLTGGRTLTGIQIEVTSSGHAHFTASNYDGVDHSVQASFVRNWSINDGLSWGTGDTHLYDLGTIVVNPTWDSGNAGYSNDNNGTFNPDVLTFGSNYAAVGGGNVNLTLAYSQLNNIAWVAPPPSTGGLNSAPDPSFFDLAIKYTYTYTQGEYVPEPTTWGLLAIGLVGLGFLRRRRAA